MKNPRIKRKLVAVALLCLMALPFAMGCSGGDQNADSQKQEQGAAQEEPQATEREITDMAGRTVTIPTQVDAVYLSLIHI